MSNQLERLLFFIVVISGALCTVEDYVIMSQCAHNKAIHLAAAGTVSVTDISQIQNITIVGLPDYVNNEFKIALYAKETQRYLCFNDNWRLVGMRELRDTCYFNETIVHGYFVFRSVVDLQRRVGFTHRGKPVGPKKSVNDACYMFNKIDAEQFFHQHTLPKWHEMAASQMIASNGNGNGSGNSRKPLTSPSRSNKNNRHKSNNQNQKLQPQQEHHGHNNNSNIIINNSSNSLSSTNKKQLALNRQKQQKQQQQQQQHQVRHHHNDPSLLARRQQHDKKQKRRRKEQLQQRVTASPTKRMTATATATATAATSTSTTSSTATTKWSTATLSIKRKGRRRKGHKPKAKPVTTATSTSSDDSLYSSSSSSSSSLGYEDAYNVSSSSITTLEPWSTWSTIDSFTPDVASVSSSSTTATSDDSISSSSSSSNYDAWSTFITELESEASAGTTTTEMSGNDTELPLHYEAELVEDAETVSTTDYETKGTSAALAATATAATTTSTAGSQLVIEQTPLQEEMARSSTAAAATTGAATPTAATTLASQTDLAPSTHKLSRHRGSGSGSGSMENSRQWLQEGDNKLHKQLLPLQPPTGSTRVPSATTSRRRPGSSAAATATATATSTVESMATTPQQHGLIDKIFSVYKNIKSNLNNTLTEASPTVDTRSTVTAATTTKKSLRKSTQKLMATPYHQLTYVRNEAGDIDIDNLDNISVYPDLFEGELDVSDSGNGNGSTNSNSRLTFVSGYLATSPTSVLPESIRIAKIKINNERRRLQLHSSQRRFA